MNKVLILEKINKSLKEKNIQMSEDEIQEIANKVIENNSKRDEDGHIIVAENVRVVLNSGISSVSEIKE